MLSEKWIPVLVSKSADADVRNSVNELLVTEFSWQSQSFDHPDIQWLNQPDETLSIERVRDLPQLVATKPMGQTRFVILANLESASVPAQNALLKILEEPPANNQFLLVTTNLAKVLPTIRSRTRLVNLATEQGSSLDVTAIQQLYKDVTSSSYAGLIELAEKYSAREEAGQLVRNLIEYLHQRLENTTEPQTGLKLANHLKVLIKAQEYLDKNANVRLVLEDALFQMKK